MAATVARRAKRSRTTWQASGRRVKKEGRGIRKRFSTDKDDDEDDELPRGGPDPVAGVFSATEPSEPWSSGWLAARPKEEGEEEGEGEGEEEEEKEPAFPPMESFGVGGPADGAPAANLQELPPTFRQPGEMRRSQYEGDDDSWVFWEEQEKPTLGPGGKPRVRAPLPLPKEIPSLRPPVPTGAKLARKMPEAEDDDDSDWDSEDEEGEEEEEILDFTDSYNKYQNTIMDTDGVRIEVAQIDTYEEATELLRFPDFLKVSLKKMKFFNLTPVQQCSMPLMLAKRDFLASSFTGSGKTGAYLLPILTSLHFVTRLEPGTTVASHFKGRDGQKSAKATLGTIRGVRNGLAAVEFTPVSGKTHRQMLPPDWVVSIPEAPPPQAWQGPVRPYALILVPTRELCLQVHKEFEKFMEYTSLRAVSLHGTASYKSQFRDLAHGADILVATPGRLIDSMHRGVVKVDRVQNLVIDEVDRMMELEFGSQLTEIIESGGMPVPREGRHTSFFSATMPPSVRELTEAFLGRECVWVDCTGGQRNALADTIKHVLVDARPKHASVRKFKEGDEVIVKGGRRGTLEFLVGTKRWRVMFVDGDLVEHKMVPKGKIHLSTLKTEMVMEDKLNLLAGMLRTPEFKKATVIVFCRKRETVAEVFGFLKEKFQGVVACHAGMPQNMRGRAIQAVRQGDAEILVATDIAARGLDMPNVTHIINFELPLVIDEFVHRCGRVGRIGRQGTAVTFVTGRENIFKVIKRTLLTQGHKVPEWYSLEAMQLPWRPKTRTTEFHLNKWDKQKIVPVSDEQRREIREIKRQAEIRERQRFMSAAEKLMVAKPEQVSKIAERNYRERQEDSVFFDEEELLQMIGER